MIKNVIISIYFMVKLISTSLSIKYLDTAFKILQYKTNNKPIKIIKIPRCLLYIN